MLRQHVRMLLMVPALLLAASVARADISITMGNVPQVDENVLLNTGLAGNPILGSTNQTNAVVRFGSNEDLTAPSNGQARIEAADGGFNLLSVSLGDVLPPGGTFTSLILNINAAAGGTIDVAVAELGGVVTHLNAIPVDANGQNFLTIVASNNQRILGVEIAGNSNLDFTDVRQVRIGGVSAIPEPASMGLLAAGLGAIFARRRKA